MDKFFTNLIFRIFAFISNHKPVETDNMNDELRAELQKQQESMLEKLSAVMVTKVGQMKRELEEVANKAHDSQMTKLKRMKFSEPPSFKKKGHEVQYNRNERVKLCITEAEDPIKEKISTRVLKSSAKVRSKSRRDKC